MMTQKIVKKIKLLQIKLLKNWSSYIVKQIFKICSIVVSTDDKQIASIEKKAGATIPWLQLPELSSNDSKSTAASIRALNCHLLNYNSFRSLLLLQLTSLFRSNSRIKPGIKIFKEISFKSVLSIRPYHKQLFWILRKSYGILEPLLDYVFQVNPSSIVIKENNEPDENFYLTYPTDLISGKSLVINFLSLLPGRYVENIKIDYRRAKLLPGH
jgi:CMP-N-acetylneuraminic acid synthetase